METENQQTKKNWKQKLTAGIALKLILIMLSFVQVHWVTIACAAGTVAAATMFGDKAHWTTIGKKTITIVAEKNPQEAVTLIEADIANYSKWRAQNKDNVIITYADNEIKSLYFHLAKAKEAAGFDKNEVIDAYKRAIGSRNYSAEALVWLYENTADMKRRDIFSLILEEITKDKQGIPHIVRRMEKINNWNAFEFFIDTVFESASDHLSAAKSIGNSLKRDSKLSDKFREYCRNQPKLVKYVYEEDCKKPEEFIKKEDFKKAIAAYKDIVNRHDSAEQITDLHFRICKCLFNAGDYEAAILELDSFLAKNKSSNRKLSKDAMLLKGRCYIQLGEINKAADTFFAFTIEYPEAKEAPESNFFIGYSYMLQGKFDQANIAFDIVAKDYPQSSYASKARLCLIRIENMTE